MYCNVNNNNSSAHNLTRALSHIHIEQRHANSNNNQNNITNNSNFQMANLLCGQTNARSEDYYFSKRFQLHVCCFFPHLVRMLSFHMAFFALHLLACLLFSPFAMLLVEQRIASRWLKIHHRTRTQYKHYFVFIVYNIYPFELPAYIASSYATVYIIIIEKETARSHIDPNTHTHTHDY